jgi:hypothetical protein
MNGNGLIFALFGIAAAAQAEAPGVTVRMYNYADVSEEVLENAAREAQRVMRRAGIETRWLECRLREDQDGPRYSKCRERTSSADILIRIVPKHMQGMHDVKRALGYSVWVAQEQAPTRAYVFYDSVRKKAGDCQDVSLHRLLGYVMAHEVAHLLFRSTEHSAEGVMKRAWSEKELVQIERGTMEFSASEARLLVGSAARRLETEGLAAMSTSPRAGTSGQ